MRAQQAFFFAAPQRDANGAARLNADGFENAHRLHDDRAAGGVIGSARAGVPGVKVRAEHHELVFLVAAGNLGDRCRMRWDRNRKTWLRTSISSSTGMFLSSRRVMRP